MKLSDYAKQNNLTYHQAWRKFERGEIVGAQKIDGIIQIQDNQAKLDLLQPNYAKNAVEPVMETFGSASETATRQNRAGVISPLNKYANIEQGLLPYYRGGVAGSMYSGATILPRDAIILCQFAYYNISIFKSTVDLLTEFSASNVFLRGGNKKSRDFFDSYFKKINIWSIQDRFFREFWRSGNVFIYKFDGKLNNQDVANITQALGAEKEVFGAKSIELPIRYVILNPADIQMEGNIAFNLGRYFKVLNGYEIDRLRNPVTEEDLQVFNNLDKATQEKLKNGSRIGQILMVLDPNQLRVIFNKKQDYETFATPTFFPVLSDINIKEEYKKIDAAIARVMQQIVLLVTVGYEGKDGSYNVNPKQIERMQELFKNESVGRVLVADFTTKVDFVIPKVADILNKDKYEIIENDIRVGLGNALNSDGGEKFANQSIKVQMFIERLKHARQAFLQEFLITEMKNISKIMGFKSCPEPFFEEINLKDELQMARLYTRLGELGIITPNDVIKAIESGQLPDKTTNDENQQEHKKLKETGLYEPLIGGGQQAGENGRPAGSTGIKQSTKNTAPIGTKASEQINYSAKKVVDFTLLASKINDKVKLTLKDKYNVKKLNKNQISVCDEITSLIVANELPENWEGSVKSYIDQPVDKNKDRVNQVIELAAKHQIDNFQAAILLAAKI